MRFVSFVLCLALAACSCATTKTPSRNADADSLLAEPDDQILLLGEPAVELDVDFDPTSEYRVGRVRFDLPVTGASAAELAGWIEAAESSKLDAVVIDFNTPGGSVSAGLRVAKIIEESPVPVYCIADGMAASMGMYLMQSCQVRLMTKRSTLMAHGPGVSGLIDGQSLDFKNLAQMLSAMEEALSEHICSRIDLPMKDCQGRFSDKKEWWINYNEALQVHAVDGVVKSVQDAVQSLRKSMNVESALIERK